DRFHETELVKLGEGFSEGARIAQVATWNDNPVGDFPPERLEDPVHDCLLPLEAEGIDAVDEVNPQLLAHLADALHRVVEVTDNLNGECAIVEGLGKFAVADLSRTDENHRLHQFADARIEGK